MMKPSNFAYLAAAYLAAGLIASPAFAKLPPAPPISDAEKAAKAEKDAASKAKEADLLGKAQDKAAANYKKGKGVTTTPKAAATAAPAAPAKAAPAAAAAKAAPAGAPMAVKK